ncbi:universal stress protein [Zavarzinia sp. CC-PAN008]|uniref:universal stress protein n=1 Tax=Zavarzinia sp. CC-PAN008 TaxID=3243332 RepID=UPI003F749E7D
MYKDIAVHLDGSQADAVRLAAAEGLARRHGAHLLGLYLNVLPEVPLATAEFGSSIAVLAAAQDAARAKGDQVHRNLAGSVQALDLPAELRRFDVIASLLPAVVASQLRVTDLLVALRPYNRAGPAQWPEVVEAALRDSGRPVLLVPEDGVLADPARIVIAWSDSREAAHAVAAAMPLLRTAREVVVALVEGTAPSAMLGREPGADLARHLDRHGAAVTLRHLPHWPDPGEGLLNEAIAIGADLLVMGAHGKPRLQEWIMGSATRTVLTHSRLPVLMAH